MTVGFTNMEEEESIFVVGQRCSCCIHLQDARADRQNLEEKEGKIEYPTY